MDHMNPVTAPASAIMSVSCSPRWPTVTAAIGWTRQWPASRARESTHSTAAGVSTTGSVFRLEGTAVHDLNVVVGRELSRDTGGKSVVGPVAARFIHDFNNQLMPILLKIAGRKP